MTFGFLANFLAVSLFVAAMIYSALLDVVTMTVSDRLVIALLAAFPVLAAVSGWPLEAIAWSAVAAMMTFFVSVALFASGWIGGGDGKLATATILWVGAENAVSFVAYTTLLGGACALALLGFRRLSLAPSWQRRDWVVRLHAPSAGIPYAVAIGLAGLSLLPSTLWLGTLAG